MKKFAIGLYVIVKYENSYYPGEAPQVSPRTSAKIRTIERSCSKLFWRWPSREDELEYAIQDIIKAINPPSPTAVPHCGTSLLLNFSMFRVFLSIPIGQKQFEQC